MDYLEDLQFAADFDCRNSSIMYGSIFGILITLCIIIMITLVCIVSPNNSFSDYTNWLIVSSVCLGIFIVGSLSCPVNAAKKRNKEIKNKQISLNI